MMGFKFCSVRGFSAATISQSADQPISRSANQPISQSANQLIGDDWLIGWGVLGGGGWEVGGGVGGAFLNKYIFVFSFQLHSIASLKK